MSQSQQQTPLDQERLNAYVNQFKNPFQAILSNLNQMGPNCIDQLIQQCVTLEEQVKVLRQENEKLTKEKVMAKPILKENEITNEIKVEKLTSK